MLSSKNSKMQLGIFFFYAIFLAEGCTLRIRSVTANLSSAQLESVVVAKVYNSNSNWMDYVLDNNGGTNRYNQPDVACNGWVAGGCIHGGEIRKIVTSKTSCTNLSAQDALSAFSWICDSTSGTAVFYSESLMFNKNLKDLLDSAGWLSNYVTVYNGATAFAQSSPSVWWTNTISPLPDNSSGSSLVIDGVTPARTPGTILTLSDSRATAGYFVTMNKLAMVTLGNAVLSYSGNPAINCNGGDQCVIYSLGKLGWYEISLDGSSGGGSDADYGLYLNSGDLARIRNPIIQNMLNIGLRTVNAAGINIYGGMLWNNGFNGGLVVGTGTHDSTISGLTIFSNFYGLTVGPTSNNNQFNSISIAGNGRYGVSLYGGAFNNTFRSIATNHNGTTLSFGDGISIANSNNNSFYDVYTSNNNGGSGIAITGTSTGNTLSRVQSSNNFGHGYVATSPGNVFTDSIVNNNRLNGIAISGGVENIVSHVTSVNNDNGAVFDNGANRNTLNQVILLNGLSGILFSTAASSDNSFSQTVVANNIMNGINLGAFSNNSKFTGYLLVGNNTGSDCLQSGGTNPGLVNGTCTTTGVDGSSSYTGGFVSDALLRVGRSVASTIVGKVVTDDVANASDTLGFATFPAVPLNFNWNNLDNRFRGWGKDGSAFPNADHSGRWTAGNGRIWDLRIKSSDTTLLNKSGDGSVLNGPFIPGLACPAAVGGNVAVSDQQTTVHTYLLNAMEVIDPSSPNYSATGNHNGLCESNEACIYSPNFGAYQGEGGLSTCNFSNGTVTGVTMWGFATNGN